MDTENSLGLGNFSEAIVLPLLVGLASSIFACFLIPLFHFAAGYRGKSPGPYQGLWALPNARRRLVVVGALAVPWVCYWLLLWPGVTTNDSLNQISQALGLVPYSDHHPIAHTLAIQAIVQPASAFFGNTAAAIGATTLVQCIVLAIIVGLCVDALREFAIPGWALTLTLVFYALHPLMGWFSVSLWKDVWLSVFILAFATLSAIIVRRSRLMTTVGWRTWTLLILAVLGMMLSKKTGVYVAIPAMLVTLCFLPRSVRLRWAAATVSATLLYFTVHLSLMAGLQAKQGSEVEAWSLPAQQIARVAHEGSLSPAQTAFFEPYFSGIDPGTVYSPHISDPVKNKLDAVVLQDGRAEFVREWLQLGTQYPVVYVEAFLAQTYGYWYPGTRYWMVSSTDWTAIVNTKVPDRPELAPLLEELTSERDHARSAQASAANAINEDLRGVPIIGWTLSLGLWTWSAVILGCVAILRRQFPALTVAVIAALVWATCMISPVHAEARYAFPLFLLLPLLCASVLPPSALQRTSHTPLNEARGNHSV